MSVKKIAIFTVGYYGRATYRALIKKNDIIVTGFYDNNPNLWGTTKFDLPIWNPKKISEHDFDTIAVPGRVQKEITEQLLSMGIKHEKIWHVAKNEIRPDKTALDSRTQLLKELFIPLINFLNKSNIPYWAMYSCLLAIIRGDEPASFADFDIFYDSKFTKLINDFFVIHYIKKDPENSVIYKYDNNNSNIEIINLIKGNQKNKIHEPAIISLMPVDQSEKHLYSKYNLDKKIPLFFFTTKNYKKYFGLDISIPHQSEILLEFLYGKDWKTPHNYWDGKHNMTF
ncbi:hypothetical protein LZ24_01509 [Desulfobotulus alkaliphilus]|uniref:LicD family protein n=1 Tax=Desulfobotulus alkaliphilus TaxID=622671 RepID=A0A562RTD2_9BACT|nr:hypothetical protein [Desulfobotulus alkaliphilus]TWI72367.1 hypothetical protein LZ24_01509 [Desulfobotulus alkaliphilus]